MSDRHMSELGLEYNYTPIVSVRIHRTDGQWLVEYRKAPTWKKPWTYFWWYNDGKYVEFLDAKSRAERIAKCECVSKIKYTRYQYDIHVGH